VSASGDTPYPDTPGTSLRYNPPHLVGQVKAHQKCTQNMSQTSTQSGPRQRSSGGRNTRNSNRNRRPRRDAQGSGRPQGRPPRKTRPKSLWQRFLAIFSGGSTAAKKENARSATDPTTVKRVSSRKPEIVEVTSSRLYVGNLNYEVNEKDLEELFAGVGTVQRAEIVSHQRTQRSKGYAFVEMTTKEEALRAVNVLNDEEFMGRKLVVSGAKSHSRDRDEDSEN